MNSAGCPKVGCQHGDQLLCANTQSQIAKAVCEILQMYAVNDFQCEPHHQHQHFAEPHTQEVKKQINTHLDCTGSSPSL
jgi:hypothetical protein